MSAVSSPGIEQLPQPQDVLKQSGDENFTVATAILGRRAVRHLMAIYGFARLVDDVGDEAIGDREALLDLVEAELCAIYDDGSPRHLLMIELAITVRDCGLPIGPFLRLIEANRVDQRVTRYETFTDLIGYCQLSAAPVGEMVLGVFGATSPDRVALSDRICNALQIIEHLQDLGEDLAQGRVYMPQEDLRAFGCEDEDFAGPYSDRVRALIAFEAERARSLLASGAPLARKLPFRQRLAIAGFVAGGRRALDGLGEIAGGGSAAGEIVRPNRRFAWHFVKAMAGR